MNGSVRTGIHYICPKNNTSAQACLIGVKKHKRNTSYYSNYWKKKNCEIYWDL